MTMSPNCTLFALTGTYSICCLLVYSIIDAAAGAGVRDLVVLLYSNPPLISHHIAMPMSMITLSQPKVAATWTKTLNCPCILLSMLGK